MNSKFKLIIFDLDGVIIDSIEVMQKAFQAAYNQVVGDGIAPFTEYRKHLGRGFLDIMQIMGLPTSMHKPFVAASNKLMCDVALYPGIIDILTQLRSQRMKIAIATGKEGDRARLLLDKKNIIQLVDKVIGSDEVDKPKPDPAMINYHLTYFNIIPEQALFLGDSVSDLKAGKAANVKTAAVMWGYGIASELLNISPDFTLQKAEDILSVVALKETELASSLTS